MGITILYICQYVCHSGNRFDRYASFMNIITQNCACDSATMEIMAKKLTQNIPSPFIEATLLHGSVCVCMLVKRV